MNRYAKSYSKSAIFDSGFSTQEYYIYLINLKIFGDMKKINLIKKNVHEKPVGMKIINRLMIYDKNIQPENFLNKVLKSNK